MSSATLSTQLQTMTGTASESTCINQLVAAWAAYFAESSSGGNAFQPNAAANAAMAAALAGISTDGLADDKMQAGIIAWWDTLDASPGTYYSGATALNKPANLTSIAADLASIFASNKDSALSLAAACDAIAAQLHTRNGGGTTDLGNIV